ncbi:MAG TPA: PIG-L family deacetylase, partial [Solirubrobacteraceae bacterium]
MRVLHLAPHPDDEAVGAPATLLGLVAAGHDVVNLACSLGRPADQVRREAEAREACARAGFALEIVRPPPATSRGDDLAAAQAALTAAIAARLDGVDLVVGPSPHDGHHGHEVVGRAARDAVPGAARPPRLWLWGVWADLPLPT